MTQADQDMLAFLNGTLFRFVAAWSAILCKDVLNFRAHRSFTKHIRQYLRTVARFRRDAFARDLKARMLASSTWRQRIVSDLGGRNALRRWEDKQRLKTFALPLDTPSDRFAASSPLKGERGINANSDSFSRSPLRGELSPQVTEGVMRRQSYPRHKLDCQGQFFLAPVHLGAYGRAKYGRSVRGRYAAPRRRSDRYGFRPIAVTAGELRYGRRPHRPHPGQSRVKPTSPACGGQRRLKIDTVCRFQALPKRSGGDGGNRGSPYAA